MRRLVLPALALVALAAAACESGNAAQPSTPSAAPASAGTTTQPTATAVAEPTPTPTPGSTRTPGAGPVEAPPAGSGVDAGPSSPTAIESLTARALAHVRVLSEDLPPRVSATDGELTAAEYLVAELDSYGYEVELQGFTASVRPRSGDHLEVVGPATRAITTNIFTGSGEGDVTGPLIFVGLGRPDDLPDFALTGAVALVERGVIPFRSKAENVFGAGADAMVVFNNAPGIFNGTLEGQFDRPSVTISGEDGDALKSAVDNGPVNVRLRLATEERPSRNVVATRPASGAEPGSANIVVIGGHYDAVPGTAGANDNASGTATILVLAEELARTGLPFELRVIAFGSEELGLLGSAAYVASLTGSEKDRIVAMFNYDALASGELEIGGQFDLTSRALEIASEIGTPAVQGIEPAGASSDHASFRDAGIPSMFFFGSDFSLIHTPADTISAMTPSMMGQAVVITLNGLLDGLGE